MLKELLTKEQLEKFYIEKELTTSEIGKIVGCHKDTVLYWLRKHKIARRNRSQSLAIKTKRKRNWLYQKYIVEELSTRDIAKTENVDHMTVIYWLKQCGIPRRTREESLNGIWSKKRHPHLGMKGETSYAYGRKMSDKTKQKIIDKISGPNNYNWKGGVSKNADGYIVRRVKGHPKAGKGGYVLEHRLVVEKVLGRYLRTDEIVHHINGDKTDNRLENLEVTTRADHARHHYKKKEG